MSELPTFLQVTLLLAIVIVFFNVIIFVHELGHFLAARWRGLQVDRFQIWFGKPVWSKTWNGVQYGLGWIPAGGFVALPQMAPMEAIEGGEKPKDPLPPVSPLDKIIVAFAGPLFSMLLALACAGIVWKVGKPKDFVPTQIIGGVEKGSAAEKAGLLPGDKILAIDGESVHGFFGSLDSIRERIILGSQPKVTFLIERQGEQLEIVSGFNIPKTSWWQRGGVREVGIEPKAETLVFARIMPNSPAEAAGLKAGDTLVSIDGQSFLGSGHASRYIETKAGQAIRVIYRRDGKEHTTSVQPVVPLKPEDSPAMIGVGFFGELFVDEQIVHPGPFAQVSDSLRMMWTTVSKLLTPGSNVNVGHLSGPVGIGSVMFEFLKMENGLQRILHFMVLFNVNLAILNMLPIPVLDGGHITLAIGEAIRKRPISTKPLEIVQTVCALLLISLMLFVTSKDIADRIGLRANPQPEVIFPEP